MRKGNAVPPQIVAAETASGMDSARPFSPGKPMQPFDGYSRVPRTLDFQTGFNIASRPRSHERVAFSTLKGLIEAYDVAQMCIWHRIDSIRSLEWSLVPEPGFSGDPSAAIDFGTKLMRKPDRRTPFKTWLSPWLYDILAYDAGTLYRLRNRGGAVTGLRTVDGTTIAPLLDAWGNTPEAPAEGFVQYANGLPWSWLTEDDLIYQPFRQVNDSPYGTAPLESILLNANTDLRFQAHFLQRFTAGNVPEALAMAPENFTPDQVEQLQEYWDAFMLGNQEAKHQIRWLPGGSKIEWSNVQDFSDSFSLFLMRKTCSAFHVVPEDLGFTENSNRSVGETQADVQHRVGDLPLIGYLQDILTDFLREDMGLPLLFQFDTGQEKEDRLALAEAWKIYIDTGMASPDEGREIVLGLPGDPERPTPRFYNTTRSGPIPLAAIQSAAGRIDPETFGPADGQPALTFAPIPGVTPSRAEPTAALPVADEAVPAVKETTTGITATTGITSVDLIRVDEDDETARAAERAAFVKFAKGRRRAGSWRPFEFRALDRREARQLTQAGRLSVRKACGEIAVAGLCVRAADTGRILMLQRALCNDDPAAGTWEIPGGHLDDGETPLRGAWREWAEETRMLPPPGTQTGSWTSVDGVYMGIVWTVADEGHVPLGDARDTVDNPDDPDGDAVEAIAWWDPAQLAGNPAVRAELLASLNDVMSALGIPADPDPDDLVKAVEPDPKGGAGPSSGDWPAWGPDEDNAQHWAPLLAAAILATIPAAAALALVAGHRTARPGQHTTTRADLIAAITTWITHHDPGLHGRIATAATSVLDQTRVTGLALGMLAATGDRAGIRAWSPVDVEAARAAVSALGVTGTASAGVSIPVAATIGAAIATSRIAALARRLAGDHGTDSPDVTAGRLRDVLGDEGRAYVDTITTTTAAISEVTIATYADDGVTRVLWVIDPENPCPTCLENQAEGPQPIGSTWPSGDTEPPAHPRCRCGLLPA